MAEKSPQCKSETSRLSPRAGDANCKEHRPMQVDDSPRIEKRHAIAHVNPRVGPSTRSISISTQTQ